MSTVNETNKSRGSKLEIVIILTIGILTSLLIIQFTGPYLAKLPSNPYKGDAELGLPFGYFQAGILEVLIAFMLIMCHDFGSTSINKYLVMLFAGLILLFATINAMMEDLAPHIQTLSSSYAKLQEASFKMEEADRQIKYMSTLGINKNPTNSVLTNREITALKKSAFALQREASENLPWLEVLHNLLMKLILVSANAFIFWKAGSKIYRKEEIEQVIATDYNGIVTDNEPITTHCNGIVTKDEPVTTEDASIVTEQEQRTLQLESELEDKEKKLAEKQEEIEQLNSQLGSEKEATQAAQEQLTEARDSLKNLKAEKTKITDQLAQSYKFDSRNLTKEYYEDFCRKQGIEFKLQAVADEIYKHTEVKVTPADLSRSAKAGMVMETLEGITQKAA